MYHGPRNIVKTTTCIAPFLGIFSGGRVFHTWPWPHLQLTGDDGCPTDTQNQDTVFHEAFSGLMGKRVGACTLEVWVDMTIPVHGIIRRKFWKPLSILLHQKEKEEWHMKRGNSNRSAPRTRAPSAGSSSQLLPFFLHRMESCTSPWPVSKCIPRCQMPWCWVLPRVPRTRIWIYVSKLCKCTGQVRSLIFYRSSLIRHTS